MTYNFEFSESIRKQIMTLFVSKGEDLAKTYQNGDPYPHIVIDNFLPTEVTEKLLADYPDPANPGWIKLPTEDQRGKCSMADDQCFPASIRLLIQELNSKYFIHFLEKITGITALIPDAMLDGGGLHMINNGGKLSVHVDFSHSPRTGLNRRLNLLLYLNKDWKEEYNGYFEFWDNKITKPLKRIAPVFNRCVIFSTSAQSFHGHPLPVSVPEGIFRRSVALYYFSNGRSDQADVTHNTIFKSMPGESKDLASTIIRFLSSDFFRSLIPPIVYGPMKKMYLRKFGTAK